MCGIAGIIDLSGSRPAPAEAVLPQPQVGDVALWLDGRPTFVTVVYDDHALARRGVAALCALKPPGAWSISDKQDVVALGRRDGDGVHFDGRAQRIAIRVREMPSMTRQANDMRMLRARVDDP